ncbi:integral membrane protein [Colletotrichum incanum]|uniref:Integral membrane protein n=1 Tax=Colletotrichum incanum TaxID=1573173 RepID=A0A167CLV2_COLIC|nr:integral membrane protein [Colletotrichum incanum]
MSNTTLRPDIFGSTPSESLSTDTRRPIVIGVASAVTGIAIIFLAVRVYIRGYLLKAWGLDDTMFIWSCFLVPSVLMYQITFACVKATFILQYRRAFALPHVKTFCDIFLGVIFFIMGATLISSGLILRVFLQPYYLPNPYTNAALNLLTDIIIFILPLALLRRVHLGTTQKIGLIASFAVGIFAISVLRISSLSTSINTIDIKYKAVPLVLFSLAESTSRILTQTSIRIDRRLWWIKGPTDQQEPVVANKSDNPTDGTLLRGTLENITGDN